MRRSTVFLNSKRKETDKMKKIIAILAALSIIFTLAACGAKPDDSETTTQPVENPQASAQATEPYTIESGISTFGDKNDYKYAFYLEIVSRNGNTAKYGIYTKAEKLGDALSSMGIIDGEEGPYGLMIESVLGEEHIYETSGYCWMIYVNGEQAQTGIDSIDIKNGETYSLRAETF